MYQFYLISKINVNGNMIFMSTMMLMSVSAVALNYHTAIQGSVFYVWLFSCNNSMSPNIRKCFLGLKVIKRLQMYRQRTRRH